MRQVITLHCHFTFIYLYDIYLSQSTQDTSFAQLLPFLRWRVRQLRAPHQRNPQRICTHKHFNALGGIHIFAGIANGLVWDYMGVRDKTSAMWRSFPGTWEIDNWYLIKRMRKHCTHCTLSGRLSKLLELWNGTNGLWPVCRWNDFPRRYSANLSQAQMRESASFSICA